MAAIFLRAGRELAKTTGFLVVASWLACSPVFGLTWSYEAELTALIGGFPAGLTVSGTYTFDDVPPITPCSAANGGNCYSVIAHDATIGGQRFTGGLTNISGNNDLEIRIADDICCVGNSLLRDRYTSTASTQGTLLANPSLEIMYFGVTFEFDDNPNNALTSTDLPLTTADLMGFPPSSRRAVVTFRNLDTMGGFAVSGTLTSFVPEPSSALVLSFGLVGLAMLRRSALIRRNRF